jgi:Reverse transcriptase (RNA-dependent DNA polymerase)
VDLPHHHPALRRPPRTEAITKAGGGIRRITRLEGVDADTYRRLVARVAPAIERSLGPCVIANRVSGPALRLEDWRVAHRRWRRATAPGEGVRLRLDVADCYGSIEPDTVAAALASFGAEGEPVSAFLRGLAEHGVAGLPVGPEPSAVLANAVLYRLDLAIASSGAPHVRWVDDVVAVVDDRQHAHRVLDAARRSLDELGLRPNAGKTSVEDHRRAPQRAASFVPGAVR